MKIKITEIEANSEELRASNSVADGLLRIVRNAFEPRGYEDETEESEE